MLRNWKTSLSGLGAIISGIALIFKGNVAEGVTAIITGIGLVSAKDNDKK